MNRWDDWKEDGWTRWGTDETSRYWAEGEVTGKLKVCVGFRKSKREMGSWDGRMRRARGKGVRRGSGRLSDVVPPTSTRTALTFPHSSLLLLFRLSFFSSRTFHPVLFLSPIPSFTPFLSPLFPRSYLLFPVLISSSPFLPPVSHFYLLFLLCPFLISSPFLSFISRPYLLFFPVCFHVSAPSYHATHHPFCPLSPLV